MKTKIKVEICAGTACFVMGASEIMLLPDHIPDSLNDVVDIEIEGANCMEECKNNSAGRPPFVKINGELIPEANVMTVLNKIYEIAGIHTDA
ncbi:MAG: hypothetical protein K6E51_13150 [Treponema sp.]|nr:hypothetical protein [Treponema sp.]